MTEPVTVTLPRDEYYELCNLLRLLTVVEIRPNLVYDRTNYTMLAAVFHRLTEAGKPPPPPRCANCKDRLGWYSDDNGQWVSCAVCCDEKGDPKKE